MYGKAKYQTDELKARRFKLFWQMNSPDGFLGNGGCFADAQPADSRKRFHRQPVSGGYLRYCSHAALQHHR